MVNHTYKFVSKCHSQTTHPRSGHGLGQETFVAPSAGKQTRNYYSVFKILTSYFLHCNSVYLWFERMSRLRGNERTNYASNMEETTTDNHRRQLCLQHKLIKLIKNYFKVYMTNRKNCARKLDVNHFDSMRHAKQYTNKYI